MLRTGLNLCCKMRENHLLKFCYRWQHVSNGKGYDEQNPYYEGQGFVLMFTRFL